MEIKYSDRSSVFSIHTEGIPYLSFDMLDRLGVPNLYSTRYLSFDEESGSGVTGLRTAVMKDDDINEAAPHVLKMRDRLAAQIGSSVMRECITEQKHTNFVHVVTEDDLGPLWPEEKPLHRQFVDGMVTDIHDVLLTVFGGDCPPVYLADPARGAVGLVHAGWKGTLGRIPAVGIAQMTVHFGCDPADMYAAIGPGVCMDCYEMGDEVYEAFASEWGREDAGRILRRYEPGTESEAYARLKERNGLNEKAETGRTGGRAEAGKTGKYHLDLRAANLLTLLRAGIPADHIAVSNVCTMCNSDVFYSYRAGRLENEQTAMIVNRFKGF